MINAIRHIALFTGLLFISHACVMETETVEETFNRPGIKSDLPEILTNGKLTVLIENSSTSYFIYKEKKMGFEYELLKLFADEIGVRLDVKVVNNLDNLLQCSTRARAI